MANHFIDLMDTIKPLIMQLLCNNSKKGYSDECFMKDDIRQLLELEKRRKYINLNLFTHHNAFKKYYSFHLSTPEIEICDIVRFIETLRQLKFKSSDSAVYIDMCQSGKFYVGIACIRYLKDGVENTPDNMAKNRLNAHRDNGGGSCQTNFTYIYPVISNLTSFYGDKEDEDLLTILMSKCVGDNVRGGVWASPFDTPDYPPYTVEELKTKLLSKRL
jgi:hypothetical protein